MGYQTNSIKWIFGGFHGGFNGVNPTISSDGTIYCGGDSFDSSTGNTNDAFVALNRDGTLKWKYVLANYEYLSKISPAINSSGVVYFCSSKYFYAFNPDGTIKWRNGWPGSSPVIGPDDIIYVGARAILVALYPADGSIKWRYDLYSARYVHPPVIGTNGDIYFSTSGKASDLDAKIYCLSSNGSFKWAKEIEETSAPSLASDGTVYVAGTGDYGGSGGYYLYAFNPDGSLKWKYSSLGGYVPEDVAPAIGPDGTIYIGSQDKNLYAINPNGTLKFKFATGAGIESSPAIDANGTIYFGSNDKNFYALNPDGTLKWKYTTTSTVRTSPSIAADGTIYTGDNNLYAFGPPPIITISGKIRYENRIFNEIGSGDPEAVEFKPVRFAKVEIIRASDKVVLGTGQTDKDGKWSIEVKASLNDKVYLKCYGYTLPENPDYHIAVVKAITPVNDHYKESEEMTITQDKVTINLDITEASGAGGAFNIFDCLVNGIDKVRELNGSVPQLITVNWQKGIYLSTGYGNDAIKLNGSDVDPDEYDDAIILHEYGHFVMEKFSYKKSPQNVFIMHNFPDTNQDIRLSWSEGWANYFSCMVRNNLFYINIDKDEKKKWRATTFNIETLFYNGDSLLDITTGQDTEVSVSSILWDIYDSSNDSGDTLCLGAQPIWDTFRNINSAYDCVLEDFYNIFFTNSANEAYHSQINNIFAERKVFYSTPSFKRGKIFAKSENTVIPNGTGQSLESKLSITEEILISNLNVFVDIAQCYKNDLVVKLISPLRKEAVLHNKTGARPGQSYEIFAWYQPPYETIPDGNLPGVYQDPVALDIFKDDNAKGDWILNITGNQQNSYAGVLNRWKLEIKGIPAKIEVSLQPGWNFVSFPLLPEDKSIKNVLSTIEGSYSQVSRYNPITRTFEHYVDDSNYNQFNTFEYCRGYEIFVTNPLGCSLIITGKPAEPQTIALKAGWNLIGDVRAEELRVEEALKPLLLGIDYSGVCRYNPLIKSFETYSQDKKEFTNLKLGEAYYLKCLKDINWTVEP